MFIQLNQQELEAAVTEYLRTKEGIPLEGRQIDVRFVANRKPPSTSAEVEITNQKASEKAEAVEPLPDFNFAQEDEEILP